MSVQKSCQVMRRVWVTLGCGLLIGLPATGFAQENSNLITKSTEALLKKQAKSPVSGSQTYDYSGMKAGDTSFHPFTNPNMFCPEEEPKCRILNFPDTPERKERTNNFNYYGSMVGFAAGMNSKFHSKQTLENYLKGDLSLMYITLGLTEPAVAAGLFHALNYVGNDVNNRLQSEQTFFSQMAVMPEIGDQIGQAHINCMSNAQSQGKNWVAAQAACSGDTASLSDTKIAFDDAGLEASLSFETDPNWDTKTVGGEKNMVNLSDYLFKQDGADTEEFYQGVRDNWIQKIGDIQYMLTPVTASSTSSTSGGPAAPEDQGTRALKFRRIDPTYTFEREYQTKTKEGFNNLLVVLNEYCKFKTGQSNLGRPPINAADHSLQVQTSGTPGDVDPDNYWYTAGTGEFSMENFSIQGFSFSPTLGDALFTLHAATGTPDTNGRIQMCERLDLMNDNGPYSYEKLLMDPKRGGQVGQLYFTFSQRIGFGQALSFFMMAEKYVKRINIGPFDVIAKKAALEMLYEAAGTSDLQGMYDLNMKALEDVTTDILNKMHQVKGIAAQNMKAGHQKRETGNPHTPQSS